MTTAKRTRKTKAAVPAKKPSTRTKARKTRAKTAVEAAPEAPLDVADGLDAPFEAEAVDTEVPEVVLAARVAPAAPRRPLPDRRRGVFFDVENTSRAEDISRVLAHLALDWIDQATEFFAVGNWRVIGHDTARLLARHGARLVHSAPAVGVRDWSDLRIAVAAGVWLASARPGDVVEIVSDDQAFDAVGDVAASLGVEFRRTSYRALAGLAAPSSDEPAPESKARNGRRRGGRRRGRGGAGRSEGPRRTSTSAAPPAPVAPAAAVADAEPFAGEGQTAPLDEIVGVVSDLMRNAPAGVTLDTLANELRSRGYQRPPGSPRLITRIRRIKELEVTRNGMIRLLGGVSTGSDLDVEPIDVGPDGEVSIDPGAAVEPGAEGTAPRRRRRRGGRRRRGRRGGGAGNGAASDVEAAPAPLAAATEMIVD